MEYELVYGLPKAEVLAQMAEGDTLKTEFIGGKPYQVDMSLAIYDEVEKNGQIQID